MAQPIASDTPSGNSDPDGNPHPAAKKLLAAATRPRARAVHLGSARHASRTEPSSGRFNASRKDRAPCATSPRSRISSPQQRAGRGPPARCRKALSRPGRLRLSRHRTTRSSSDSDARSLQRKRSLIAAPIRWPCCRVAEALQAVGGGSSWRRYPRRRTAVTATVALTEPSTRRRPPARCRS
jgi:hypothetical protein